ncbi:MAG: hypothetical protein ABJF88_01650 [Rhodothermales bacterium]
MRFALLFLALAAPLVLTGCDGVFGSKDDATTDEIFDEGQVDPTLLDEVGYVPLNPFYTQGAAGGTFDQPVDVYVGYDELIYVADAAGLHVLDLAGRPQRLVTEAAGQPLRAITAVVQDRSLDLLVAARRDTTLGDRTWDLPVVYRLSGVTTGAPTVEDIVWHPFDDRSRSNNQFRDPRTYSSGFSDEDASFTDVAPLADNSFYVSRSGPVNTQGQGLPSIVRPFNGVLAFTEAGENTRYISALSATQPSLLSAVYPSALATPIGPPQRTTFTDAQDFFVAQDPPTQEVRYPVLSVLVVETPLGTEFRVNTDLLGVTANPDNGDGFLYEDFGMRGPTGLAIAADETGYLFATDAETDSLYIFNRNGVEGVAPPPAAGSIRPVNVSFGGEGSGALSFRDPQGVAYFDRIVYVADMGNNRIARYRLNTDFE